MRGIDHQILVSRSPIVAAEQARAMRAVDIHNDQAADRVKKAVQHQQQKTEKTEKIKRKRVNRKEDVSVWGDKKGKWRASQETNTPQEEPKRIDIQI